MVYYNDMVYCSSDTCTNTKCERNKKHISECNSVPVFYMDYESFCSNYDNKAIDSASEPCYNKQGDKNEEL